MHQRPNRQLVQHALLAATAAIGFGTWISPAAQRQGPVLTTAVAFAKGAPVSPAAVVRASDALAGETSAALEAFAPSVRGLSHPRALEDAFRSYFAFKTAHPESVTKP